jgi:hypothetical protein
MGKNQSLGSIVGGVGGFMIGGPAGAALGAGIGGSIGGNIDGSDATNRSIRAQERGVKNANQLQMEMYQQQRQDSEPWRQAGQDALAQMQQGFSMEDFQQDPSYQFRMQEGLKAVTNSAQGSGGRYMKDLMRFGQGLASQEYQNHFNRQATIAGLGHSSTGQMMGGSQNYGNQVSANHMGMANAQGAAIMGQHQSNQQLFGDLAGAGATYFASDERLKTSVTPFDKADLDEMRSHLKAYSFRYIDEGYGEGDWVGVMAQDLEKSKLGKYLVSTDESGNKFINSNKVMSLFLATMAEGQV